MIVIDMISRLLATFLVSSLVVSCSPDRDLESERRLHAIEECTDPVHCVSSEVAIGGPVTAGQAEEWVESGIVLDQMHSGIDVDRDGFDTSRDCDDNDRATHPNALEVMCDKVDQNCDGIDTCDSDADGFVDSIDCDPKNSRVKDQCYPRSQESTLK